MNLFMFGFVKEFMDHWRSSWTILKNIHNGKQVGSQNGKRGWILYICGVILNEFGGELDSIYCSV